MHDDLGRRRLVGGGRWVLRQRQADARAAQAAILEDQLAAMVFHDLFHDRKSEAGPLAARRHVRLGQSIPLFARQALAIVLDLYDGVALAGTEADPYLPRRKVPVN